MVVILIPAYKPDEGMLALLNALIAQKRYAGIVVVDDGSGSDYRPIFEAAEQMEGVVVVRHAVNQGKGRALKTGFNAIMNQWPEAAVITADASIHRAISSDWPMNWMHRMAKRLCWASVDSAKALLPNP